MAGTGARTAVIGASGFIGAALTRELHRRQVATSCFTRATPFVDDSGHLHRDVLGADTIFWLAGSTRPATVTDATQGSAIADHRELVKLLRGLGDGGAGGRRRVVAVSSGGTVYDSNSPSPHREDAPLAPPNEYGKTMRALESLLTTGSSDYAILRVSSAYGPGQRARLGQGVLAYWLEAAESGRPIHILGRDDVARDYVYIDDVTAALVSVHQADRPPAVVNIGSGVPTTLRELVDVVKATIAPRRAEVTRGPARSFDAPSSWLDISLAAAALDWKPRYDLRAGLRRTWQQRHPT